MVRVYLPPDANTLLSVADHCLRSRDYVNVIVAGKQPALAYLTMDEAIAHCTRGLGIWQWAGTADGETRTWCWPAPATSRRWRRWPPPTSCATELPELRVRVVNVVDLMRLQPDSEHPHGLPDREFDALFTTRQAGHLRLPRLSLADPPAHLPPHQSRQHPRARLQGGAAPRRRRSTW